MHRIELVTEVQPMFYIPGKLHLTWETPGPVDVDLSKFTEQEKNWLRNGKLKNVLRITNLDPEATKEVNQQTASNVSAQATVSSAKSADTIKQTAEETRKQRELDAQKTLSAPLPALTRFVEKCGDLLQLKVMQELEEKNKKRTKVIGLLTERIKSVSFNVGSIVGSSLDDSAIHKEFNMPDIEETVEDTVTIKLGAED